MRNGNPNPADSKSNDPLNQVSARGNAAQGKKGLFGS